MCHPTKLATHPVSNKRIPIDKDIFELVKAIWSNDIDTMFSCQNWDDTDTHISLIFNTENLNKFINVMSNSLDRILYTSFNDVLWGSGTLTTYKNNIYIEAWVPDIQNRDEESILHINLLIPIILTPLIETTLNNEVTQ